MNAEDLFEMFNMKPPRRTKGNDINGVVDVSFLEAVNGCEKDLKFDYLSREEGQNRRGKQSAATRKSRAVKLSLGKNQLTLTASSPDAGNAEEEITVRYAGPPIEIGFNARYLLDIAEQIEGEGARFRMADAAAPTLVEDIADQSALYVLMPMRV